MLTQTSPAQHPGTVALYENPQPVIDSSPAPPPRHHAWRTVVRLAVFTILAGIGAGWLHSINGDVSADTFAYALGAAMAALSGLLLADLFTRREKP